MCILTFVECLVGDLHGDLAKARCALEIAGVLSSDGRDKWTGGETVLLLSVGLEKLVISYTRWNCADMRCSFFKTL